MTHEEVMWGRSFMNIQMMSVSSASQGEEKEPAPEETTGAELFKRFNK